MMDTLDLVTALGLLRVPATGTVTRALQAGQWWDGRIKLILDEADPGWAIDIGAHVGWFTIYLAQAHWQVIAVEPYPPTFELLRYNMLRRPGLEHRVQCWPLAAYNRVTTLELDGRSDQTDIGSLSFTAPGSSIPAHGILVPAAPLDQYLPHDAPVTLIKVDAQGADLKALLGLRQTISRCRPLIVFEWEETMASWQGVRWQDHLDFFEQLNYSVTRISDHGWDFVARPQ